MSLVLAIDPGTTHSGVVELKDGRVIMAEVLSNRDVLQLIDETHAEHMAVEMIASYGMAVGAEVFETCVWIGRFIEAWSNARGEAEQRIYRRDVKLHLCGSAKAKDANIRQALIDLYGGKAEAIGTSKKPGPLYGVKSHAWAALAVAVTAANT